MSGGLSAHTNDPQTQRIRSAEVAAQVSEALLLRGRLLDYLNAVMPPPLKPKRRSIQPPKHSFLQTLALGAEGWSPILKQVEVAKLDRTSSMLAGPFFTSAEYPVPGPEGWMWLPVVQLDLRDLTGLSDLELGDGLLQLWCDADFANADRGFIRVIPREDVDLGAMTPFEFVMPQFEVTPIDFELVFDVNATAVSVIAGFESLGFQCQGALLEPYTLELEDALLEPIANDLERFVALTDFRVGDLHLFGSYLPIQYSTADVDAFCLVSFPRWGSDGNAQLLVRLDGDNTSISFWESLR